MKFDNIQIGFEQLKEMTIGEVQELEKQMEVENGRCEY